MLPDIAHLVELCKQATESKESFIFDEGVLAFGGTNELSDWLYNFDLGEHLGYHKGFYRMTRRLTFASGIPHSEVSFVTGYSLGGSVASIYAIQNNKPCVTFSAPRILWRQKDSAKQIIRLTAQYDPVSSLPFNAYHPSGLSKEYVNRDLNPHSLRNYR